MVDPEYAVDVFRSHFDRVEFATKRTGFTCLEVGSGDSLLSAPIAHVFGARSCYLVDAGDFASRDMSLLRDLLALLASEGKDVSVFAGARDWSDGSVDFVWSHAVLEHVRLRDFSETQKELRRVLREGGCCSHTVDLTDHFNGQLNNLRFSEARWEGRLFASSGFYTNRIRFREMMAIFRSSGFEVKQISVRAWKKLPIERKSLDPRFSALPEEDLLTHGFDVVLR
jgi:SAM-dependent methyltransferase